MILFEKKIQKPFGEFRPFRAISNWQFYNHGSLIWILAILDTFKDAISSILAILELWISYFGHFQKSIVAILVFRAISKQYFQPISDAHNQP